MEAFEDLDPAAVLAGDGAWLTPARATALADAPLDCVETPFPHVHWSVEGPDEELDPRADHPLFYGCFDWHSAVHSHWTLVRSRRLVGDHPRAAAVDESIDGRLTDENVRAEVAYLEDNPGFENPYGWAWLLRLAAELALWNHERAEEWRAALEPLEETVVELVREEFLAQERPLRVGTHDNSAFALSAVLDYARVVGRDALVDEARETAEEYYRLDRDAPVAYEPLGWDFLSPSLAEADCMRRTLAGEDFAGWLEEFLPAPTVPPHDAVLEPVEVEGDTDDGMELHLVGLNLSRAWCLAGIADTLGDHEYVEPMERAARRHVEASLADAFTEEYAGSHWLRTFVLYLGTRNAGGIAPS